MQKILHPFNRAETIFSGDERLRGEIRSKCEDVRSKCEHRSESYTGGTMSEERSGEEEYRHNPRNLDGFMIGRASFGNPWCFLPDGKRPVLEEILETMELHARLLIDTK